jgi:FAD/FMN-containing dehydrogenase
MFRSKLSRRGLLVAGGAAGGALATRALYTTPIPFGQSYPETSADTQNALLLNDASELSPIKVAQHITLTEKPDAAMIDALRAQVQAAANSSTPIAAHAARHSMGGQSLAENGLAITFNQQWLELNKAESSYRVAAGTRWRTVIKELDAQGFSPKVMQSNNDFGVASTFSVNAHGWPVTFSAGGTTARSIKLLTATGELLECSREKNPAIFSAALGGYGMFGIITELEMEMVPNRRLVPKFTRMPAKEFGKAFENALRSDANINMAYGRMNVSINGFFDDALMITYTPTDDQQQIPAASGSGFVSNISRDIFRQQVGSDRWKKLRWNFETKVNQMINAGETTRNSLLNEPVITLDDGDPTRTDILHEYFVSPDRFAEFVQICQKHIPSSFQELLNITLRFVDTDHDSVLTYATEPRIASVLLFSQEKSLRAEEDMARLTRRLIDDVLAIGGTYYLPYRPHATPQQFQNGYRRHGEFVELKRRIDPNLIFRNKLWDTYLSRL